MSTTPHILIVGNDSSLQSEFEAAIGSLRKWTPVLHHARSHRQAVEVARSRRPEIICTQLEGDPRAIKPFAEEIQACSPGTAVVALYRPENLGFGENEHTVIIEAMRSQVQDFLRRPLAAPELQQLLDRLLRRPAETRRELGRILSFVSNKGGVGKSTMSVSTAVELARRMEPGRVLLVDVSLHLGSCAPMLDLAPTTSLASAAREKSRLDETLLRKLVARHECGLDVLSAPIDAVEAADIDDEALTRVLALARRSYDYVIVDTFPMLDGMIMAILDLSDRAYVVAQNTVPNVLGCARLLPVLLHLGYPRERTRVVLNNNFESAPGGLTLSDVEARLEREVDFVVPYQKRLITALNTGRPYMLHGNRWWGFGRTVKKLVDDIQETLPVSRGAEAPAARMEGDPAAALAGAE